MPAAAMLRTALSPGMRGYYLPLVAGLVLAASAFLPWVEVGDVRLGGVPGIAGLWILGLGTLAAVLASLSLVTRRNSRHPLLLVGLTALAILVLAYRVLAKLAADRAWAVSQALAIVDGVAAPERLRAHAGPGMYAGLAASAIIVIFGLTIVVRQVREPYAADENDDV
jgi:hypothetical protein